MPALAKVLKRIFSEGVESASKQELEALSKLSDTQLKKIGSRRLFRKDSAAEDLFKRGFSEEIAKTRPLASEIDEFNLVKIKGGSEEARDAIRRGLTKEEEKELLSKRLFPPREDELGYELNHLYDPGGIYWGAGKGGPESLRPGYVPAYHYNTSQGKEPLTIEGIMRPGAEVKFPTYTEPANPDFLDASSYAGVQLIQQKRGNVLARLGDKYKILGTALGLGSQLSGPDQAEAGIFQDIVKRGIGAVKKASKRSGEQEVSSAAKALTGTEAFGKTIKTVKSGPGDWRYLVYEDGTEQAVKKDFIHHLSRESGTKQYMEMFDAKEGEAQLTQALKSLEHHRSYQKPFTTKAMKDDWARLHNAKMQEAGLEPEKWTYIHAPYEGYIPSKYVKTLLDAGAIKIKGKK
jgi:hypothetical protein